MQTQEGAQLALADEDAKPTFFGIRTRFTNAGFNRFKLPGGMQDREGFAGWMGLGGSILQFDVPLEATIAYAPSHMECDPHNIRALRLQRAFAECCRRAQSESAPRAHL